MFNGDDYASSARPSSAFSSDSLPRRRRSKPESGGGGGGGGGGPYSSSSAQQRAPGQLMSQTWSASDLGPPHLGPGPGSDRGAPLAEQAQQQQQQQQQQRRQDGSASRRAEAKASAAAVPVMMSVPGLSLAPRNPTLRLLGKLADSAGGPRGVCELCDELGPIVDGMLGRGSADATLVLQHAAGQAVCDALGHAKKAAEEWVTPTAKLAGLALRLLTPGLLRAKLAGSDGAEGEGAAAMQAAAEREGGEGGEAGGDVSFAEAEAAVGMRLRPADVLLLTVCKKLYSLSKDERHDEMFVGGGVSAALVQMLDSFCAGCGKQVSVRRSGGKLPSERASELPVQLDALVYACGALKNTSQAQKSEASQRALYKAGAVGCMASLLECAVEPGAAVGGGGGLGPWVTQFGESKVAQVLVQATGITRNLSTRKWSHKQLWSCRLAELLCALLRPFVAHAELMENVGRVLYKLTTTEEGRLRVSARACGAVAGIVGTLAHSAGPRKQRRSSKTSGGGGGGMLDALLSGPAAGPSNALAVRMCFTLGNLTASNAENRAQLLECDGAGTLLRLLSSTMRRCDTLRAAMRDADDMAEEDEDEDDGGKEDEGKEEEKQAEARRAKRASPAPAVAALQKQLDESRDVLVKLLRALANCSMDAGVGREVAGSRDAAALIELLNGCGDGSHEELMLNTVSVLTNLSFHAGGSASFCGRPATEACAALVPVLLQRNEEAVIEAARCVGNLSRDGAVRRTMAAQRVDELFVVLLDHACRDVVYTACGALMNVASDEAFKRVRVRAACRRRLPPPPPATNRTIHRICALMPACSAASDACCLPLPPSHAPPPFCNGASDRSSSGATSVPATSSSPSSAKVGCQTLAWRPSLPRRSTTWPCTAPPSSAAKTRARARASAAVVARAAPSRRRRGRRERRVATRRTATAPARSSPRCTTGWSARWRNSWRCSTRRRRRPSSSRWRAR